MMRPLDGKVALVTGASGGIGGAVSRRLATEGAAVMLAFNGHAVEADRIAREIRAAGGRAATGAADVSNPAAVTHVFQATIEAFGGIDLIICNAGVYLQKPLVDTSDAELDRVFDTNTRGTFFCLREAAKHVRDGGRIVVTSSIATHVVWAGNAAYAGSKAATEQFVRVLSRELGGRQVTVNAWPPAPPTPT